MKGPNIEKIDCAYCNILENTCIMNCGVHFCYLPDEEAYECIKSRNREYAEEGCRAWKNLTAMEIVQCENIDKTIQQMELIIEYFNR